jgi:DNA modification methylase
MLNTYPKQEEINGIQVYKTYISIDELKPDPQNPRDITDDKGVDLIEFLSKYPALKPVLVDVRPEKEGQLIGGNKRLEAYKKMGVTELWVEPRDPITDAQAFEMGTIDNMQFGHYVLDKLTALLKQYEGELDLTKLDAALENSASNLEKLLQGANKKDVVEDEAPVVDEQNEPQSKMGEVYQLGRHRLMCGDATKIEDVEKLMNGRRADMVFTDPPYGVDFQSNMRTASPQFETLKNDDTMLTEWIAPAASVSSGWFLFCTTWKVLKQWLEIGEQIGKLTNMVIWNKGGGGIGDLKGSLATDYEIILAYNRGADVYGKRIGTVWSFNRDNPNSYTHPTQKPIALPAQAIETLSSSGIILDVFGGSGSTLMASEQLERTCYMMELDPKYCDVIRKRFVKFNNNGDDEGWIDKTPTINDAQQTNQDAPGPILSSLH